MAARASFGCVEPLRQRVADPREVRGASPAEQRVDRPVDRVEEPEPEQAVRDVRHDGREHGRGAVCPHTGHPPVEEERQPERGPEAERDGNRGKDERVDERRAEDVVRDELPEVVEPDEVRRADEVVLGEGEDGRDERRREDEDGQSDEVGREHQRELAPLAHDSTRIPVARSKRWTCSGRTPTPTSSPSRGRPSAGTRATSPFERWTYASAPASSTRSTRAVTSPSRREMLGTDAELGSLAHRSEGPRLGACQEVHPWRAQEPGHEPVGRAVVDLLRRSHLLDAAGVQDRHAVGEGESLDLVVRDVHHRRPDLTVQAPELGSHLDARPRVEVRERLVQEIRVRVPDEGAREGHPLALAAR